MYLHVYAKMQRNHSCTSKMRTPPNLANSVMAPYFFIYANRNKAEPREVTKQVVWIILRNRIFHGTIRHIRSGFSLYARTLCALTLLAYALKLKTACLTRAKKLEVNFLAPIRIYWLIWAFVALIMYVGNRFPHEARGKSMKKS